MMHEMRIRKYQYIVAALLAGVLIAYFYTRFTAPVPSVLQAYIVVQAKAGIDSNNSRARFIEMDIDLNNIDTLISRLSDEVLFAFDRNNYCYIFRTSDDLFYYGEIHHDVYFRLGCKSCLKVFKSPPLRRF